MITKRDDKLKLVNKMKLEINIPRISILEVELIINKRLFYDGVINEKQYYEVSKIIYEKINQLKNKN